MRKTRNSQLPLGPGWLDQEHAKELKVLSDLLDEHPKILDLVRQDLCCGDKPVGAEGMSAEQVLRVLLIKQMNGFSYRQLTFHLEDSQTYRTFCRLNPARKAPSKSALCSNIKHLQASTLEQINRLLVGAAEDLGIEKGAKSRVDCTVVETTIHPPEDSQLLWDCIRVLTRLMGRVLKLVGPAALCFPNRQRRAKRRCREISTTGRKAVRKRAYLDLLKVASEVYEHAQRAHNVLGSQEATTSAAVVTRMALAAELERFMPLTQRVIEQTRRRVVDEEKVPAAEKVVSIFEEHTDIIIKDYRNIYYGHKICLTGGASSMILDCQILRGNPADSTLSQDAVSRQSEIYGRPPRQVSFDGAFSSGENLKKIKKMGVADVVFSKSPGITVSEMAKSTWVYKKLRNFRAGIEGCISFLKRAFGLDRCTWRTWPSFESYVWSSVVTCNLLLMARSLMK